MCFVKTISSLNKAMPRQDLVQGEDVEEPWLSYRRSAAQYEPRPLMRSPKWLPNLKRSKSVANAVTSALSRSFPSAKSAPYESLCLYSQGFLGIRAVFEVQVYTTTQKHKRGRWRAACCD